MSRPRARAVPALIAAIAMPVLAACRGDSGGADADTADAAALGFPAPPSAPYEVIDVADGGLVAGAVRVDGAVERDTTVRPTNDVAVCGEEYVERRLALTDGRVEGAVVWLHDIRAGKRLPRERLFELLHARCRLTPRIQAVVIGGTLNVRSSDPLSHRTRFTHLHAGEDLAVIRQTDAGSVVPVAEVVARPGLVHLQCDVHPWTTAWIAVFDHPYFAVTDAGGSFTFVEVPPGRYTLVAWHERLGIVQRDVVVSTGTTTQADVRFRR